MKQNIKVFFIALIIGAIAAYMFAYKYDTPLISNALGSSATYFYIGAYNDLEMATKIKNNYDNALIYNDKGIYKVIIGVYSKQETIDLMRSYFHDQNINFYENNLKIDSNFLKEIANYELLIKSSPINYYSNLNNSILTIFSKYIN